VERKEARKLNPRDEDVSQLLLCPAAVATPVIAAAGVVAIVAILAIAAVVIVQTVVMFN
jgi:hypothetical protein